jgi:hypothetical protein
MVFRSVIFDARITNHRSPRFEATSTAETKAKAKRQEPLRLEVRTVAPCTKAISTTNDKNIAK